MCSGFNLTHSFARVTSVAERLASGNMSTSRMATRIARAPHVAALDCTMNLAGLA
jgi:hypothetical protein